MLLAFDEKPFGYSQEHFVLKPFYFWPDPKALHEKPKARELELKLEMTQIQQIMMAEDLQEAETKSRRIIIFVVKQYYKFII